MHGYVIRLMSSPSPLSMITINDSMSTEVSAGTALLRTLALPLMLKFNCQIDLREVHPIPGPGSICQYKEDDLVPRPPTLFTAASLRMVRHAQSLTASLFVTTKFGSFFEHVHDVETEAIRQGSGYIHEWFRVTVWVRVRVRVRV